VKRTLPSDAQHETSRQEETSPPFVGEPANDDRFPAGHRPAGRLVLRSTGRVRFLRIADIEWVDAAHNYVRIHTLDGKTQVAREPIGVLESRLDPQQFLRIHRSTIINADCVRELEVSTYGTYVAILTSGQRVTVSRSYRERLGALLGA
jgi:two-component system LytT family response regulator